MLISLSAETSNIKAMSALAVKWGSLSLVDRVPFNSASILGNQGDSGKRCFCFEKANLWPLM